MHFKKMKGRREKKIFFWVWIPLGGVGTRKGGRRVYMVDVFCIHI
jgi:hypothetical protein